MPEATTEITELDQLKASNEELRNRLRDSENCCRELESKLSDSEMKAGKRIAESTRQFETNLIDSRAAQKSLYEEIEELAAIEKEHVTALSEAFKELERYRSGAIAQALEAIKVVLGELKK